MLPGRRRGQRRAEHQWPLPQPRPRDHRRPPASRCWTTWAPTRSPRARRRPRAARRRRALRGDSRRSRSRAASRRSRRRGGHGRGPCRPGRRCSSRPSPRTRWSTSAASATCCSTASASRHRDPARGPPRAGRRPRLPLPGGPGTLRPRIREYRPILIGVDGGADAPARPGTPRPHRRRHGHRQRRGPALRCRAGRRTPTATAARRAGAAAGARAQAVVSPVGRHQWRMLPG